MRKSSDRSTSTSETPRQKGYIMSKFENYLKKFDITSTLTDEDIEKNINQMEFDNEFCSVYEKRFGVLESVYA